MDLVKQKNIPVPTVRRLPQYLSFLKSPLNGEVEFITASKIARDLRVDTTQITKDFSAINLKGKPKIGYEVKNSIEVIETFLGYHIHRKAFLAGIGNLGTALINFTEFYAEGIEVLKGFDIDPKKIGGEINDVKIFNIKSFREHFNVTPVDVGIIAVPNSQTQGIADIMIACGVKAIWNFSTMPISAPDEIIIENTCIDSSVAMIKWKLNKNKSVIYKNRML